MLNIGKYRKTKYKGDYLPIKFKNYKCDGVNGKHNKGSQGNYPCCRHYCDTHSKSYKSDFPVYAQHKRKRACNAFAAAKTQIKRENMTQYSAHARISTGQNARGITAETVCECAVTPEYKACRYTGKNDLECIQKEHKVAEVLAQNACCIGKTRVAAAVFAYVNAL